MSIKIFITGGTIDDLDYTDPKDAPIGQQSLIPDLLKQARVRAEHNVEQLIFKDSRLVDEQDRKLIAESCQQCTETKIVITHGTATMPDTARYLSEQKIDKTIVLLGAMVPANKPNSDALFNLGAAITAAQLLQAGVYVTMNGQIFPANDVIKKDGYFQKNINQ